MRFCSSLTVLKNHYKAVNDERELAEMANAPAFYLEFISPRLMAANWHGEFACRWSSAVLVPVCCNPNVCGEQLTVG